MLMALAAGGAAFAQKASGVLRVHIGDSSPSMSMLEEVDANPAWATMGLFKQPRQQRIQLY